MPDARCSEDDGSGEPQPSRDHAIERWQLIGSLKHPSSRAQCARGKRVHAAGSPLASSLARLHPHLACVTVRSTAAITREVGHADYARSGRSSRVLRCVSTRSFDLGLQGWVALTAKANPTACTATGYGYGTRKGTRASSDAVRPRGEL